MCQKRKPSLQIAELLHLEKVGRPYLGKRGLTSELPEAEGKKKAGAKAKHDCFLRKHGNQETFFQLSRKIQIAANTNVIQNDQGKTFCMSVDCGGRCEDAEP